MRSFFRRHAWLLIALCIGILVRIGCSFLPGSGDINNHLGWSHDYLVNGPAGFYEREFRLRLGVIEPNYPPISIWIFAAVRILHAWIKPIVWFLNVHIPIFPSGAVEMVSSPLLLPAMIRWPAIIADVGIAVLVYMYIKAIIRGNTWLPTLGAVFILGNPAFIYNSAIWGQIDAIPVAFILASLYCVLYSRRYVWTVIWCLVALLTKQTAVIYVPVLAYMLFRRVGWKQAALSIAALIIGIWIFLLPFYQVGNVLLFPLHTYIFRILTAAGLPYLSNHAFNIWGLVTGFNVVSADRRGLGVSYAMWAYMLSGLTYGAITYIYVRRNNTPVRAVAAVALISFGMFLFLPRMHERHLLMALPFILIWTMAMKQSWAYWFLSAFHLANLYHNRWYPPMPLIKPILADVRSLYIIALGLVIIYIFFIRQYLRDSMMHKDN